MRVAEPFPVQNNPQLFNFESSSYGYGFRNWTGEQHFYNNRNVVPQMSSEEAQQQQEMERQRQLVEKAKNELLARFPFYAINLQNSLQAEQDLPDNIPMPETPRPVEAPENFEMPVNAAFSNDYNFNY